MDKHQRQINKQIQDLSHIMCTLKNISKAVDHLLTTASNKIDEMVLLDGQAKRKEDKNDT